MKSDPANGACCQNCGTRLPQGMLEGQCAVCLVEMIFQPAGTAGEEECGRSFAEYELHEEIGRGGMGLVYRAWQPGLRRTVALKLLLGGAFSSREAIARFKKEAQIAAALHHPHLVPIHAADEADGQPYYVMELIEGQSLGELTRGTPLPAERAARYLLATARAVEYAHSQGVLHRDLKPSNILIDALDQPRVADFGLARTEHEPADFTLTGETIGSPAFMAPELASGGKNLSSPSADLYALGAVLYQALTGRPPFQGESILQILDQAKNAAPLRPRQLVPGVPVDLETVCLKCLEKEPTQRYESVGAFADDLARFLCGESVRARPVSGVMQAWQWMRRRPALTISLLALLLSLAVGSGLVLRKARENQRQAAAIRQLSHKIRSESYANGIQAATLEWRQGNPALVRNLLTKNPGPADPEFRDFTARWLTEQIQDRALAVLPGSHGIVLCTRFSHDGRWLATGTQGGFCQIWEVATRRLLREWQLSGQAFSIDFSPDDAQLYIGTGAKREARGIGVWSRQTGEKSAEFPGGMASLSADGKRLATVETDFYPYWEMAGPVRVWEVASHRLLAEWQGAFRCTAISPDGLEVAMATRDGQVTSVGIDTQERHAEQKLNGTPRGLTFSPDGRWLAAWCSAEASVPDAVILDRRREEAPAWILHPQQLASLAFSPDSSHCMTAGSDYSVRRWSLTGKEDAPARLLGSPDEVWSLDFHPQQPLLVTGNKSGDLTLWPTLPLPTAAALIPHSSYERPRFSGNGQLLATQETMTSHVIRDVTSGEVRHRLPVGFAPIHLGFAAQEIIGFSAASSRLIWWDTARAAEVKSYPCPGLKGIIFPHLLIRITPDGGQWLTLDSATRLGLHHSADGSLITSWTVPEMNGQIERDGHLALSPDGKYAAWNPTGSHTVWLLRPGLAPLAASGHRLGLSRMEFSPDSQTLATASVDHTIRFWDSISGKCTTILAGHFEEVSDISFSPDGRTLASIALGDSVKFWQLPSGRELLRIEDPGYGANLLFSPDGKKLAASSDWKHPHGPTRGLKIFQAP